jgi:anti-sigma factor RsiW
VNSESKLLVRYLDGELSPEEAREFQARLDDSPELARELCEMQTVGGLVRAWAERAESRADSLLAPTLARVARAEQKRSRHASLGLTLAAVLALALPWAPGPHAPMETALLDRPSLVPGAAIERLEAGDTQARVFVVGSSHTPVVWLADEVLDDDENEQQDPG